MNLFIAWQWLYPAVDTDQASEPSISCKAVMLGELNRSDAPPARRVGAERPA